METRDFTKCKPTALFKRTPNQVAMQFTSQQAAISSLVIHKGITTPGVILAFVCSMETSFCLNFFFNMGFLSAWNFFKFGVANYSVITKRWLILQQTSLSLVLIKNDN